MRDDFRGSKTLIKVRPMYLDVKVKETKLHCGRQRLKCKKQIMSDYFLGYTVLGNVHATSLVVEIHQVRFR